MREKTQTWRASKKPLFNELGVSMVQFAIAFPVFMMFVVVIIDLGRITAMGNTIRESLAIGMQSAVSVANLDNDVRGLPSADYSYQRSKIARGIIEQQSLKLIRGIGHVNTDTDANVGSANVSKLHDIQFTETRISDGPENLTYKIAVLLPGECVTVPALGVTECNRATLGISDTDAPPTQAPADLIRKHPVKLVTFAKFDSFTPWLFKTYQKFEQYGFRQPIPPGPFPSAIDPQPYAELKTQMDPGSQEPLGAAEMPEEEPQNCVPNWGLCITGTTNLALCPCLQDTSPTCTCAPNCCRPD